MSESRDRRRKPTTGKGGSRGKPRTSRADSPRDGSARKRGKGQSTGGRSTQGRSRKGRSSGTGRSGDGGTRAGRGDRDSGRSTAGTHENPKRRLPVEAEGLPRFVVEALMRVTPPKRHHAALAALGAAAAALSEGQFHQAVKKAEHAKSLASRDATIREVLGLASYRVGDWSTALRELRTYRRLSGETTHMPVEMDSLRALGRSDDVVAVWQEFRKLGGGPAVKKEARVVYASFLIDQERLDEAHDVIGSVRVGGGEPWPEDLRLWYVASRVAALQGKKQRARELADAILLEDPSFPGLDELDRLIEAS